MTSIINTIKKLQQSGYRLTYPRREVLKSLNFVPTSVSEIYENLKSRGINTDRVTIYRILDLLTKLEIVWKTDFGDKTARFELATDQAHHHHLVCDNCGSVEDIPMDDKILARQVENQSKFKLERHNLEFFGYCIQCQ